MPKLAQQVNHRSIPLARGAPGTLPSALGEDVTRHGKIYCQVGITFRYSSSSSAPYRAPPVRESAACQRRVSGSEGGRRGAGARGRRHRAVVLRVERVQDLGQDGGDRRAGGQSFVAPPPFTAPAAHVDKMVGIDRPWVQHDRHLRLRRAVLFATVAAGGAVRSDGSPRASPCDTRPPRAAT